MKKKNSLTITTKIVNFIKSLCNHIKTGMQKSSKEEIKNRYKICQGCEFFNFKSKDHQIKATCDICGCSLSDEKIILNKLAWKDQACPEGKW